VLWLLGLWLAFLAAASGLKTYKGWRRKREPCPHGVKGAKLEPSLCAQCQRLLAEGWQRETDAREGARFADEARKEQRRAEEAERRLEFARKLSSLGFLQTLEPMTFQRLIWLAYEKAGYVVQETPGGPDGGVDGFLERDGRRLVLQCKRFRSDVSEPIVRDLFGTAQHHRADGAVLVTTGRISGPARSFCEGKNIELLDGEALLILLETARITADLVPESFVATEIPAALRNVACCPRCGGDLRHRLGRRGPFIGCSNFPTCRYTRDGSRAPRR
jgi:restriction system protein